jgi:hypothetical protein
MLVIIWQYSLQSQFQYASPDFINVPVRHSRGDFHGGDCPSTHLPVEVLHFMANRTVLWEMMPWSLVDIYWRFVGTCCLHLQGRKVDIWQTIQYQFPEDSNLQPDTRIWSLRTDRSKIQLKLLDKTNYKHSSWLEKIIFLHLFWQKTCGMATSVNKKSRNFSE